MEFQGPEQFQRIESHSLQKKWFSENCTVERALQEAVREPIMPGLRAPTVPQDEEPIPKFNMQIGSVWRHELGFQGRHQDKQKISYKKEGDGFQADCICENGYTYTFYFRNVAAPRKYFQKKCSPLHARVLFLFDQLPSKNMVVGLDNLYISVRFCREAVIRKNNVTVHGVCQKEGRGIPPCVLQKEVKGMNEQQ
jgi:hypothetical protein